MQSVLVLTKERRESTKADGMVERVILDPTAFVAARDKLSAVVRLGVDTLVQSAWQRQGRKVLAGVERLARFDAYAVLVAQVHQGGGRLDRNSGGLVLRLRVLPADQGDLEELSVYMPALERDRYLSTTLDRIASGEWPLKRIGLRFERGSAKVKAQLWYVRPARVVEPGSQTAVLSLEHDGTRLVVRCQGRELHVTDHLHRLVEMKARFKGIHDRLRASLGKARRWGDLRRALLKAGSFEKWSESPIHELSARIVDWARSQDAGVLEWAVDSDGEIPWHRLREHCRYKGAEIGLQVVERRGDDGAAGEEMLDESGTARAARKGRSKAKRGPGTPGGAGAVDGESCGG